SRPWDSAVAVVAAEEWVGGRGAGGDGVGGVLTAGDEMQQDGGCTAGAGTLAAPAADTSDPGASGPSEEDHCLPDITLGPRPGLPQQLLALYDNVLRAVLSCCVAWSLTDTAEPPSSLDAGILDAGGLLQLPLECTEALRGCLQACGGVLGQARQISTAVQLLQQTSAQAAAARGREAPEGADPCVGANASARMTGAGTGGAEGRGCRALPQSTRMTAALTAALAGLAACGTLRSPPAATVAGATADKCSGGGGGGGGEAVGAGGAALWILMAAADQIQECAAAAEARKPYAAGRPVAAASGAASGAPTAAPAGLAVALTLYYCEALTGSCRAVAQLLRTGVLQLAEYGLPSVWLPGPMCRSDPDAAALVMCRLAEPALSGLLLDVTVVTAARALRALVAAAGAVSLQLPGQLVAALVDSAHSLRYDGGAAYQVAEGVPCSSACCHRPFVASPNWPPPWRPHPCRLSHLGHHTLFAPRVRRLVINLPRRAGEASPGGRTQRCAASCDS
ncbi:hypothetical protein VaNZ11_004146, partial [Volvox africanus]